MTATNGEATKIPTSTSACHPASGESPTITSNITAHQLARLLLAQQDAPVLVLFDNQCCVASELYVVTNLSDPPEWADPDTVYIDCYGG